MSELAVEKEGIDKALIRRSFSQASSHYNQFTSLQRTIGDRLVERFVEPSSASGYVLDIGAGTGYLTGKILSLMPNVKTIAIDLSEQMLRQTIQNVGCANLNCITADADQLCIRPASMNAVCSNLAFQWCSDLSRTFHQAYDVLKPNGQFVFTTFGPKTLCELKASWKSVDTATHVNDFVGLESIKADLDNAGFKDVIVDSEDITLNYAFPKDVMLELKGMGAHNINSGRHHGLTGVHAFKKVISEYELMRNKNGIPASFQAIYVHAKK